MDVAFGAAALRQLPKALRPVFALIMTLFNKYHSRKLLQHLEPEI